MSCAALIVAMSLSGAPAVVAAVGVTDACQDDIKDDYTAESRRKAKNQLAVAKTNRANPAKCRGNVMDARKELQKGRRDKKVSLLNTRSY